MISPNAQVLISFNKLCYSVNVTKGIITSRSYKKDILFDVTGTFQPAKFSVIMGASGSGKTSLLNVVSGYYNTGSGIVGGSINVNGRSVSPLRMRDISAYVQQEDVLLDSVTVREAITMSALLRLPHLPAREVANRVKNVIESLDLMNCLDTKIGSPLMKGISGGEKKRCCIGIELVMNNSVIFLDEPTSGLDTYMAFQVVKLLKKLCKEGRTIVATIHQPSSHSFLQFDELCLLGAGKVIYSGAAENAVKYFGRLGFTCGQFVNPADFIFMEVLNINSLDDGVDDVIRDNPSASASTLLSSQNEYENALSRERIEQLSSHWSNSAERRQRQLTVEDIQQSASSTSSSSSSISSSFTVKDKASFFVQTKVLATRVIRHYARNPIAFNGRLAQNIVIGLLIGLIYLDLDRDQTSIQDRAGSLFMIIAYCILGNMVPILAVFAVERAVFRRENIAGMYGLWAYFVSKVVVELPFNIILPIVFGVPLYYLCGFQGDVFEFMATIVLTSNCGAILGLLSGALFESLELALVSIPVVFFPFMLLSGFLISIDSIPIYLSWINWISPIRYGFEAIMLIEFNQDLVLYCQDDEYAIDPDTGNAVCPITSGVQVIQQYGFTMSKRDDLLLLLAVYGGSLLLAVLSLYAATKKH